MAIYAIGDVQGCFHPLMKLLEKINFSQCDTLWFTGDLVNRGSHSLETLEFIKSLGNRAVVVLGNHDIGMLAVARGAQPYLENKYTFKDILGSPNKEALLLWLEQQPLIHYEEKLNTILVHAGIYPGWDLELSLKLAREVSKLLKDPQQKMLFYKACFGNEPIKWETHLQGPERWRFIVNSLTRMRFVNSNGELELSSKNVVNPPSNYLAWFQIPNALSPKLRIIFGHWAALNGITDNPQRIALDTGCVWGNCLTAFRLEDNERFTVPCA